MESVNFYETSSSWMLKQVKDRAKIIVAGISVWGLVMTWVMVKMLWVHHHTESDIATLQETVQTLLPKFQQYEQYLALKSKGQSMNCVSETFNALFAQPMRGVHFKSVAFKHEWIIEGRANDQASLDKFKQKMEPYLANATWHVKKNHNTWAFDVKGRMTCLPVGS